MSEFSIKVEELKNLADRLGEIADSLEAQAERVDALSDSLGAIGLGVLKINFVGLVLSLKRRAKKARALQHALYRIIALFLQAEQAVLGLSATLTDLLQDIIERIQEYIEELFDIDEFRIDSIVFDDEGWYGGDQGHPQYTRGADREALYDIIRENNPDHEFTEEELIAYLKRANSEGCGYVAMANSIFVAFEDDPEAFERAFGYPMYVEKVDAEGNVYLEPNYDMLFIDLYSSMDNIDPNTGEFDYYHDYDSEDDGAKKGYDFWRDTTGRGSNSTNREYYYEQFLREHGIKSDYDSHVTITPSNVQETIESGKTIIISYHDGYLEDADGNQVAIIDGGHAMVITGVTEDGRYIVSSWGEEYYIDPNGVYYDEDGKEMHTTMHYDTTEILLED